MKKNRKCICCGTAYAYCGNCPSDRYKESWYAIYCGENCRKIFKAANDFFFEELTKEEAAEIILTCDLSNLENFNPVVREDIEGILKVAEPVVDEAPKAKKVKETIEVVLNDEV